MVVNAEGDEAHVTEFVKSHIDGATISRVHGKELAYTLPATESEHFSGTMYSSYTILYDIFILLSL